MIPFVDLHRQYMSIKAEIDQAISGIIESTAFIGGEAVEHFEQNFAQKYGVKHCISTANGTDSLYIIMKMLGIGPGDEVITVANSWISSSETITQTGARPVFVDIDPDLYSINEELLEAAVTHKTKAIMPVHLHGQMCEMDTIMKLAKKHKLFVIEDCAQAHFSSYKSKQAGLFGIAGSFSFYPGKNLGAYGDAGCIITNDDDLALKCRMFARHGALKKHQHQIEGINSRLDGLQAAVLNVKLKYIEEWTQKRIDAANLYNSYLQNIPQISLPTVREDSKHTFHLYVIRADQRDELAAYLNEKEIQTAIHYPTALPNLPAYKYLGYSAEDFPIATDYQSKILSLPLFPEIEKSEIEMVCNCITQFYSQ